MEKAHQEMLTLEAESRVEELRQSTGELERSLAEHIASLREALPEAGEERAEREKEILRLQSALDALAAPSTRTPMRRSPGPERTKTRQPQPTPPAQTPQPPQP
jgi:chromosome segregation ATPase